MDLIKLARTDVLPTLHPTPPVSSTGWLGFLGDCLWLTAAYGGTIVQAGFGCCLRLTEGSIEWMMAAVDDLVPGLTSSLAISEYESVEVVRLEDLGNLKAERVLLVGKLLTSKAFHKEALFGTLKRIWHTREEFTAVPLNDPKRFLFSFKSDFDRKKVMRGSPWTFDRALLLLTSTDGEVDPMSVSVDS
ncbi:unnamed protein product [Prunus armeniaca]|uniref:DUF4283 domain-containing protein n=1 Tax=Prunus armeniaca TaxID=36596 RepID=A0A6J5VW80_PRUAR|nr:unnamed protein product [Prunus armeniaca]